MTSTRRGQHSPRGWAFHEILHRTFGERASKRKAVDHVCRGQRRWAMVWAIPISRHNLKVSPRRLPNLRALTCRLAITWSRHCLPTAPPRTPSRMYLITSKHPGASGSGDEARKLRLSPRRAMCTSAHDCDERSREGAAEGSSFGFHVGAIYTAPVLTPRDRRAARGSARRPRSGYRCALR